MVLHITDKELFENTRKILLFFWIENVYDKENYNMYFQLVAFLVSRTLIKNINIEMEPECKYVGKLPPTPNICTIRSSTIRN